MTDEAVMAQVFARARVTRAELATLTGISKPTTWQSVRRLEEAGVLQPAGPDDTGRRGRVATFYELPPDAGWVFALQIDQSGLRLESLDLTGRVFFDRHHPPGPPGDAPALITALRKALTQTLTAGAAHGPVRGGVISLANPVDPVTNHIIAMPDSPFPEGQAPLDQVLGDLIAAPVTVDNDVNLAAAAERASGVAAGVDDFAYLYVGAGMGMGLYIAGRPVRGAHGLAGEVGELSAAAARRPTLARAFHQSGFGTEGGPSVRVDDVLRAMDASGELPDSVLTIAGVIAQAVVATCAIVDPALFVLGGPIGSHPALLEPVRAAVRNIWPGPVRIESSTTGDHPALRGAAGLALARGRAALLASVNGMSGDQPVGEPRDR
ncbi:ROK family transcriptional regulator [Nakamurella panacisegetis]|nr:ROK family transcriptional regulator [Nakamurella panacisegetis]